MQTRKIKKDVREHVCRANHNVSVQMDQIGKFFAVTLIDLKKVKHFINIDLTLQKSESPDPLLPWKSTAPDKFEDYFPANYSSNYDYDQFVRRCDRYKKLYNNFLEQLNERVDRRQQVDIKAEFIEFLASHLNSFFSQEPYKGVNDKYHIVDSLIKRYSEHLDLIDILSELYVSRIVINFVDPKIGDKELGLHDKIIVADDIVITGSANMTHSGISNNLESNVLIRDKKIAQTYKTYLDYCKAKFINESYNIVQKYKKDEEEIKKNYIYEKNKFMIDFLRQVQGPKNHQAINQATIESLKNKLIEHEKQNKINLKNKIQVSFSLFNKNLLSIIKKEIEAAKESIKIEMFILADKEILEALANFLAKESARKLVILLDQNEASYFANNVFNITEYFKETLKTLLTTQTRKDNKTGKQKRTIEVINDENLLEIKYLSKAKACIHDKVIIIDNKTTILGSANISKNVSEGGNLENIVTIKDEYFSNHVSEYIDHNSQRFAVEDLSKIN